MHIYKHKHHIIPRHMGGSDDPSNIVMLTIKEHAEAHRLLYEQYGRWQDELAWKGLSGQLSKEEIIREKIRLANIGNKNAAGENHRGGKPRGHKSSEETKKRLSESHIGNKSGAGNLGRKNTKARPDKGFKFITNEIIEKSVAPNTVVPEGWRLGRIVRPRSPRK